MNIWIMDNRKGVNLLFKSFLQIPVDKDIISGLLTAFNQFTVHEFKQSIESIEMAGLRWVYIFEPSLDLLFVISDTKDISADTLFWRLSNIKESFIQRYEKTYRNRGDRWEGNLATFDPFEEVIEDLYFQWKDAEIMTSLADFFNLLGIVQQIFNYFYKIMKEEMVSAMRERMFEEIEDIFQQIKAEPDIKDDLEFKKFSFDRANGFNVININPTRCDPILAKGYLIKLVNEIVILFKKRIGVDQTILLFKKTGLFHYLFNNIEFLKSLKVDSYLLKLLLLEN